MANVIHEGRGGLKAALEHLFTTNRYDKHALSKILKEDFEEITFPSVKELIPYMNRYELRNGWLRKDNSEFVYAFHLWELNEDGTCNKVAFLEITIEGRDCGKYKIIQKEVI